MKAETSIFTKHDKNALKEYIELCSQYAEIDKARAYELALQALRYYKSNKANKTQLRAAQELETRWYDSLAAGTPDYSVYQDKYFISDVWCCWVLYSRKYLLSMASAKLPDGRSIVDDIGPINGVLDMGCAFGYTTAALKAMFLSADVIGIDIAGTCQYKVAQALSEQYDFSLYPDIHDAVGRTHIDLVFASEYFEHIERPLEHLRDILDTYEPRYLIIANAFNSLCVGHFQIYRDKVLGAIHASKISRVFNKLLRDRNYQSVKTKLWNNRPAYWKRK